MQIIRYLTPINVIRIFIKKYFTGKAQEISPKLLISKMTMCVCLFVLTSTMAVGNEVSGRFSPVSSRIWEGVTGQELSDTLTSLHIENTLNKSDEDEYVIFKLDGKNSVIMFFSCENGRCGTIRIMTFFKGRKTSLKTLNAWNSSKRLVRAYLDKDQDTVLESDLDLDGGVTWQTVEQMIIRRLNMIPDFEKYLDGESGQSISKALLPVRDDVKQPVLKPSKASGHYIKIRIGNPSEKLPHGCPVTMELESDLSFDNFKLWARIYYRGPDGERSLRKKFLFYDVTPGTKQPDFKVVPVDKCSQVERVVVEEIASCVAVGSEVDCRKIMQVAPDSIIPLEISSSGPEKVSGPQAKNAGLSGKKSIILKVVELEERMSGCKAYLEVTNNTDISFDIFDIEVKTLFNDGESTINTLILGHAGDPDYPKPIPAGRTVSRYFYPSMGPCANIVGLKILSRAQVCYSGSTKYENCFSMLYPAKDSIIPVTKEDK